jgi:hypothetical protein
MEQIPGRTLITSLLASLILAATVTLASTYAGAAGASATSTVAISPTATVLSAGASTNRLHVGVTHTQKTANRWDPPAAVSRAKSILAPITSQNQMLMGWGALNPEPSPGVFDFRSLDTRLSFIRSTGATPVITLCCAPDWMKGGQSGQTDWSKLTTAPLPRYYAAFARLAVAAAKRYPDVRSFDVWNEFKGFFDASRHRWNYEAYTAFYNTVYDALKAYDPTLKVGGPYVVFDSYVGYQPKPSALRGSWGTVDQRDLDAVNYWLANKHGADFVAVDGVTASKDIDQSQANVFAGVGKLVAVTRWLRSRTSLPIWWAEVYPFPKGTLSGSVAASVTAYTLMALAKAGAGKALLWQEPHSSWCTGPCLWTDTTQSTGGQVTPTGAMVLHVSNLLRPGAVIRKVGNLPRGVVGYAVGTEVVLVNTSATNVFVTTKFGRLSLLARQTRFVARIAFA